MHQQPIDWPAYISLMAQLLEVPLDAPRREALALQLARIEAIAAPLMAFELPHRQEGAGAYRL